MNPPLILLAEDEPVLREMMRLELFEQGADVHTARDGQETLTWLTQRLPDLLLLDLLMPKVDGYAVLQHMQAQGCAVPVVILSNLSQPEEEQKCIALGAREFIVKSHLDTGELWEKVKKHLTKV